MDKNKLEEIKEIHAKANEAYNRFESSSACADQDIITDSLNTLFYEEYTDWLIGYAEESLKIESELRAKIDQQQQEIEQLKNRLNHHTNDSERKQKIIYKLQRMREQDKENIERL